MFHDTIVNRPVKSIISLFNSQHMRIAMPLLEWQKLYFRQTIFARQAEIRALYSAMITSHAAQPRYRRLAVGHR